MSYCSALLPDHGVVWSLFRDPPLGHPRAGFGGLSLRARLELAALSQPCNAASGLQHAMPSLISPKYPQRLSLASMLGPAHACFCHSSSHFRWDPDHTRRSPLYPAALALLSCVADRPMMQTFLVSPRMGNPCKCYPSAVLVNSATALPCLPPVGFASCWTAFGR
ncbi:hypothetical protein LI328DRAFT_107846 [Trichoderma asperelloides]|nr:hypothetical protein LI328DRAFT_107846 [Trichoderma asperelloides]